MKSHLARDVSAPQFDDLRSFFYNAAEKYTPYERLRFNIAEMAMGLAVESVEELFSSQTDVFLEDVLHRAVTAALTVQAEQHAVKNVNRRLNGTPYRRPKSTPPLG
ncbi:hypothetical protein M8994_16615, partial [Brucella sp. 21LCYQ03]|nr:hypothetical protein [Brucella sp. 21LCYQ03]